MRKMLCAVIAALVLFGSMPPVIKAVESETVKIYYDGQEVDFTYGIVPVDGVATVALSDVTRTIGAQCLFDTPFGRIGDKHPSGPHDGPDFRKKCGTPQFGLYIGGKGVVID